MQVPPASDPTAIVSALQHAAAATGSDFHYLLGTAMRESSLRPTAQSATSSAAGLFQFVDQTWLGLIKTHGAQYGLSAMADAIHVGSDGHYRAGDADRQAILALRQDPKIAALMAGEYTKSSAATMQAALGRPVCGGELYAAHFLGPDAACKLIRTSQSAPGASAADLLPRAAQANRSVFFRPDGGARTVREVYDWAMQQPGADAPVRTADSVTATGGARLQAGGAVSANIEMLLASVMNWQPRSDFFSASGGGDYGALFAAAPSSAPGGVGGSLTAPLALSPGLLSILSEG